MTGHVLVVDDQKNMRETTALILAQAGYSVVEVASGPEALAFLQEHSVDVVLTDLRMTPMSGLELVGHAITADPNTQVIVMTAYGSVESAVEAMQRGAQDYIQKPFVEEELLLRISRAIERRKLLSAVAAYTDEFRDRHQVDNIVGDSQPMRALIGRLVRVAPTDATVLITGESGTGKEVIARAIHVNSSRSQKPFVPVNCAAFNEQLLESELFGHAKGAFTGAVSARRGLIEEADGGTFFFDEIAETSLQFQAKLLRVIQEHELRRVGENSAIQVDIRVIAATNVDLRQAIEERRFREDLFYRLNVVPMRAPPLRDRREDIPVLVQHFLERYNRRNKAQKRISPEAVRRLMHLSLPGNVRELENLVYQAAALSGHEVIQPNDFVVDDGGAPQRPVAVGGDGAPVRLLEEVVADAERQAIRAALERNEGKMEGAARDLGISHTTLWRRMRKLGLQRD